MTANDLRLILARQSRRWISELGWGAALLLTTLALAWPVRAQVPDDELRARIDSLVLADMELRPVPGAVVAVVRGGDTLVFRGYGRADLEHEVPATPETVFQIASITKQFTAAAVLQLADRGVLSLEDTLQRWVPGFPTGEHTVRLRHLLNHTSGIPNYYGLSEWQEIRDRRLDPEEAREVMRGLVAGKPFDFEPGTAYSYSNTGYDLLGDVIEAASGRSYHEYLRAEILDPLGLDGIGGCPREAIVPHRARGYERRDHVREGGELVNAVPLDQDVAFASGSLCATVGDLVRWQRALHEERALLSDSLYRRMVTPEGAGRTYAFGLGTGSWDGHPYLRHNGSVPGFSAQLDYYPEERLHVVVLMNAPSTVATLAEEIGRAVLGLPTVAEAHVPEGWRVAPLTADADTSATHFRRMGPGLHVTSGPGAVYTHPDSAAEGTFQAQATLISFAVPGSGKGYGPSGLVLGADPGGASPAGLHFLIRPDGRVRVVRVDREGGEEEVLPWTASEAVSFPQDQHQARNTLVVKVTQDSVRLLVNDVEAVALDRSDAGPVDGPAGIRIGRGQDVHIGGFGIQRGG